jgi:C1A family cysteine protease
MDCTPNGNSGCNGGVNIYGIQYIASKGAEAESAYPYRSSKGSCKYSSSKVITKTHDAKQLSRSESAIASAAATQVVSIAITGAGGSGFMNYRSGVFTSGCSGSDGHAIAVVGYTPSYWIVRNSWGSSWGVGGYIYMARGRNLCNLVKQW